MSRIIYNSIGGVPKKGQKSRAFLLKCLVLRKGRVRHPVRNGYVSFEIVVSTRKYQRYKGYLGACVDLSHRSPQLIWRGDHAVKLLDTLGVYADDKRLYKAGT